MDSHIQQLVQTMHDTLGMTAVVTAGAGTQAVTWLLGVAGASRTLLEAHVPYAKSAFNHYIGREPEKHVTAEAARLLAGNALGRAIFLRPDTATPVVGLACTATIVTDRPKRGEHHAYVCAWSQTRLVSHGLVLTKGARNRDGEEEVVSRLMLNTLAELLGLAGRVPSNLLPGEGVEREEIDLAGGVARLLAKDVPFVGVYAHGRMRQGGIRPQLLLPGSFNPRHQGHDGLAAAAEELMGQPVAFELSVANVDKPSLSAEVVLGRLAQFAGQHPLYLTNAPTFLEKARLFPGVAFVVGYDTAVRILAPRYYGHDENVMLNALSKMRELGVRFVVAGRANEEGEYFAAESLPIPTGYEALFIPIPPRRFRLDISSTALRAKKHKK